MYLAELVVCQKEQSENTQNFLPIERDDTIDNRDINEDDIILFFKEQAEFECCSRVRSAFKMPRYVDHG